LYLILNRKLLDVTGLWLILFLVDNLHQSVLLLTRLADRPPTRHHRLLWAFDVRIAQFTVLRRLVRRHPFVGVLRGKDGGFLPLLNPNLGRLVRSRLLLILIFFGESHWTCILLVSICHFLLFNRSVLHAEGRG